MTPPVRVRFAPSPTGRLHIGGGRTALYNYLLARQTGGQFIIRLEDTDQKRFDPTSEQEIYDGLHWLGLEWDEGPDIGGEYGPYRQTERKAIYQEYAKQLIASDHAYYCFCTPQRLSEVRKAAQKNKLPVRYDGFCRNLNAEKVQEKLETGESHVIRFKMPREGSITVTDALRGDITLENKNLDDYIIVKSDGLALYHLAAMVDDHLMKITHVFRSAEWLSTFALHGHIYRAFGWEEPVWAHLSLFLKPSGKGKMSKRETAQMSAGGQSVFLTDLDELGYLPEGVVNWIALMGWSYDDKTEFFSMDNLIEKFTIEKLNPSAAAINFEKLDHFNALHIRALTDEELAKRIEPFFAKSGYEADHATLAQIAPLIRERIRTLDEAVNFGGFFFQRNITPTLDELVPRKTTTKEALEVAIRAQAIVDSLPEFTHEAAEQPLRNLAEDLGLKAGQVFGVLRGAVTGQRVSPPLFESMAIVGKEKVIERIKKAIKTLETAE